MRLIDAEGSELQAQLKFIREAEHQIYGSGSWGFTAKCERAIEDAPTVQPEPHWHPVSEQPQEEDDYLLLTHEEFKYGTFKRIIIGAWNSATKEWLEDYGDMYRAVNHPVAWISKDELLLLKGYEVTE